MKPVPLAGRRLVVGLGNVLLEDDGIGVRVAERLREDPRLPGDVDVVIAGTDLLPFAEDLEGRRSAYLIDAVLRPGVAVGTLVRLDSDAAALDRAGGSAHQLSPTFALELLRRARPGIRNVPVTLLGIAVERARMVGELSPALRAKVRSLVTDVLMELRAPRPPAS